VKGAGEWAPMSRRRDFLLPSGASPGEWNFFPFLTFAREESHIYSEQAIQTQGMAGGKVGVQPEEVGEVCLVSSLTQQFLYLPLETCRFP